MADVMVNIDVDDLAKAVTFYTASLGLTVGRRFGSDMVELIGASSPIYLLSKPAGSAAFKGADQRREYSRHWTPVHLDFVVEDISAAVERATACGAVLEAPIKPGDWGDLALMSDPFGHGFCLVQFRNRGYDEIADPS